jgi:uncharacterized protein YbjT (DUF2867 family)
MTANPASTVLVLGATGKTGRRVVERLHARGVPVRAASRSGTPPFDWEDRATWAPVLAGAGAAYLCYYPDLAAPGAADTVGAFARLAAGHGVGRLVLLSGRGEEEAERAEALVRAVPADVTVVRSTFFAQNFSESLFQEAVLAGELALPVDGVPEPFVDVDDIADIAVAALTEDGHAGRLYEVTGPRLLTYAEAVEEIAWAAGRPVRFTTVTTDEWVAGLRAAGVPDDVVALLVYLFTEVMDGRNARLADGVQRALGRAPGDFGDYAARAAAAGAWG